MRRWLASLLVSAGLLAGFLLVMPAAAAASPSGCYNPSSNTSVNVGGTSGTTALTPLTTTTSSASLNAQEGVWKATSSTTGTCVQHDYVVVSVGGAGTLYVDPPCTATVWGD